MKFRLKVETSDCDEPGRDELKEDSLSFLLRYPELFMWIVLDGGRGETVSRSSSPKLFSLYSPEAWRLGENNGRGTTESEGEEE
jgi:hypothetical protein